MTEFIADAPVVARSYCPGCEPDADPTREILDVRWCDAHAPTRDGCDDTAVTSDAFLSGSAEAGGDANRRWCELLHASSKAQRTRAGGRLTPARRRPL
ncbi:MAG TPA: hypothetical protein VGV13_02455 [Methylomirabilota bacterium]|nr:hypothetical protein [Methylomirabilota bacterium]